MLNSSAPLLPSRTRTRVAIPGPVPTTTSSVPSLLKSAAATRTPPVNDLANAAYRRDCWPLARTATALGVAPVPAPARSRCTPARGGRGGVVDTAFENDDVPAEA